MPSSDKHVAFVAGQLQLAIEALGLTQAQVARTLGITASKLGNWKRGDNYPDPFLITMFCDRYNVTMDFLYRGHILGLSKELADGLAKSKAGG